MHVIKIVIFSAELWNHVAYLQVFYESPLATGDAVAEVVDEDGGASPGLGGGKAQHGVVGDRGHGLWKGIKERDVVTKPLNHIFLGIIIICFLWASKG